jgi:phosphocarrier protein HPr
MAETTLVREFKIVNVYGIHARPAAKFVKMASCYTSDITVEKGGVKVSGKSIMGLLTLDGHQGATLRISARGPDAEAALTALGELIARKFDED